MAAAVEPPEDLLCPVLRSLFRDPVVNAAGNTYERVALEKFSGWAKAGLPHVDPLTNLPLPHGALIPNWDMRRRVQTFLASNPLYIPEGWPDRTVPPPVAAAAAAPKDDTSDATLRFAVGALSLLVVVLASALCLKTSDARFEALAQLATGFIQRSASFGGDTDAVWSGVFFLFVAEMVFCCAWLLDTFSFRSLAGLTFCAALLTAGKAVSAFSASPSQAKPGSLYAGDQLGMTIAIMSSVVLCMMLIISCFELPLLRAGGRDAVRRLTMKLIFFDGVLLLGLLVVLASIDALAPGVTAHPLVVTSAGLLAAGLALLAIGWHALPGMRRFVCMSFLATGCSVTAHMVQGALATKTA